MCTYLFSINDPCNQIVAKNVKYDIHLYHSYLSAFFVGAGVPNGEFPEIQNVLIAKCRSRFYCTFFFHGRKILKVNGRDGREPQNREKTILLGEIVREINVSCAGDPVHAGDKALTWETPAQRRRVNRYAYS